MCATACQQGRQSPQDTLKPSVVACLFAILGEKQSWKRRRPRFETLCHHWELKNKSNSGGAGLSFGGYRM